MPARWIMPPITGLIEPVPAPEFVVDDVGAIEMIGAYARVYYYSEEMPLEHGGTVQRVVQLKMRRPLAAIPSAIARLAQCLILEGSGGSEPQGPPGPRLVR